MGKSNLTGALLVPLMLFDLRFLATAVKNIISLQNDDLALILCGLASLIKFFTPALMVTKSIHMHGPRSIVSKAHEDWDANARLAIQRRTLFLEQVSDWHDQCQRAFSTIES